MPTPRRIATCGRCGQPGRPLPDTCVFTAAPPGCTGLALDGRVRQIRQDGTGLRRPLRTPNSVLSGQPSFGRFFASVVSTGSNAATSQNAQQTAQNGSDRRRSSMNAELTYLVWVTTLIAVMWVPYMLDRIAVWGLNDTVGYADNPRQRPPDTPGRHRDKKATAHA